MCCFAMVDFGCVLIVLFYLVLCLKVVFGFGLRLVWLLLVVICYISGVCVSASLFVVVYGCVLRVFYLGCLFSMLVGCCCLLGGFVGLVR